MSFFKPVNFWSCDYETTTDPNDCRVWLWAARDYFRDTHKWGNSIDSFFRWCKQLPKNTQLSFHNLKFDGSFIVDALMKAGYTFYPYEMNTPKGEKPFQLPRKSFSALVSDMGMWYMMDIRFDNGRLIRIVDSLKLLPFKIAKIAKDFKLPMLKGEIDYDEYREPGHMPTKEELEYIYNDVDIAALAMKDMKEAQMDKITIGSCALEWYKSQNKHFEHMFPVLDNDIDAQIRMAYRGGWTFANPIYKSKEIAQGIVLDVNSLYPWVMASEECILPFGNPVYAKGELEAHDDYPLFVQHMRCGFELKPGHLPTIQLKGDPHFNSTEYVHSTDGMIVELTLTNVDLALLKDHYDIYCEEYIDGFYFHGKRAMFKEYVEYWTAEKVKAKKEKNGSRYLLAKLMLNSCYGKFATSPRADIKVPHLEDNRVVWKIQEMPLKDSVYLPVGVFVTAWARNKTIRAAQTCFDRFLYADTDSLHLIGLEIPEGLQIDGYILGAWDHEATFKRGKYLHAKCYFEEMYAEEVQEKHYLTGEPLFNEDGTPKMKLEYTNKVTDKVKNKVTVAGLPASCHDQVTWENFHTGIKYEGKLKPLIVPGGTVLDETEFEIREKF